MTGLVVVFAMALGIAEATIRPPKECPLNSAAYAKEVSALAFEGTVIKLEWLDTGEFMATLDVARVWKGKPNKKTNVFYMVNNGDSPKLELARKYLIFVRPRTPEDRQDARLPAHSPHREAWVPSCIGVILLTRGPILSNVAALASQAPCCLVAASFSKFVINS